MIDTGRYLRALTITLVLGVIVAPRASVAGEPKSASFEATADGRQRILPHPKIGLSPTSSSTSSSSGGWWLGSAGMALALAAFGGVVVAARKIKPGGSEAGPLKVLSRTSLSPRHSVYLLKAGDRVLIIGTGPQGAPSLLGEMDRDEEVKTTSHRIAAPLLTSARDRVRASV